MYTDPTGHSSWKKFWNKVEKAFLSEVAVFAFAIVVSMLGGPPAFTAATAIAATAAAVTTLALDTGEGRQLIDRVGNEFFDDVLGMRPSTAHKWSSFSLHVGGTILANAGLNAMIYPPKGPPGTGKSFKDGHPRKALNVDKGKAASGDPIIDDPVVKAEMEKAWAESLNGGKEVYEQGGWILKKSDGALEVQRFSRGTSGSIKVPSIPDNAIANFHTHPYASSEIFVHGVSRGDYIVARTMTYGQRNFIIDRQGIMEYFPSEGRHDPGTGTFKDVIKW